MDVLAQSLCGNMLVLTKLSSEFQDGVGDTEDTDLPSEDKKCTG